MSSEAIVSKEANGRLYEVRRQLLDGPRTISDDVFYDLIVFDIEMKDGVPHLSELYCGEPHHEYDMDFFVEWVDEAIALDALPTWKDIFNVARYAEPYAPALKMMQQVENAGHGDSVERHLLDLVLNYNRDVDELKARVMDMLYGDYHKMYSYQGWDTLTTEGC